jgi:ribonuclease E
VAEAAPQVPAEAAAPAPAAAQPAFVAKQAPAPAVEPAAAAAAQPVAARNGLSAEALKPVLESAGLVWVNTDTAKLRAAQEAAAHAAKPVRVPRERKPLPPADSAPMQQVETAKHQQ